LDLGFWTKIFGIDFWGWMRHLGKVSVDRVRFTQRDLEVLALVKEGLSHKEIAPKPDISYHNGCVPDVTDVRWFGVRVRGSYNTGYTKHPEIFHQDGDH
jgi:hypothetical protein